MSTKQPKKLTAAQRITQLEETNLADNQNMQILAGEIDNLRQTMAALARRLNASITAGESGEISNDAVNKLLIEENTAELKGKVDFLIEQGVLEESKAADIHERSFVVGRELDEDKNVINPRIQFAVASIAPEVKELLLGKKVGDVVQNKDDGINLEVVEILDIAQKVEKNLEEAPSETQEES
jgi:hypothetical protein